MQRLAKLSMAHLPNTRSATRAKQGAKRSLAVMTSHHHRQRFRWLIDPRSTAAGLCEAREQFDDSPLGHRIVKPIPSTSTLTFAKAQRLDESSGCGSSQSLFLQQTIERDREVRLALLIASLCR